MSEIEALVNDIGNQVGLLTEQLKFEEAHLAEAQNKLSLLMQEAQFRKQTKLLLEEEVRQLEAAYFREVQQHTDITESTHTQSRRTQLLEHALECIKRSSDRARNERMAFLNECRNKLKKFENYAYDHEKLKAFVEMWVRKGGSNFELIDLPESIRTAVKNIENLGESSLGSTLEAAFHESKPKNVEVNGKTHNESYHTHSGSETILKNIETDVTDLMVDSNMVDASRLRISTLDVTKEANAEETITMESDTMILVGDDQSATADTTMF